MGEFVMFQMWQPFREMLIAQHKFYVDQAHKRLLSQFEDMEAEADKAAEDWLERNSARFDPDRDDPASFYERAQDESINFYTLLSDMRDQTRLSTVAGMYHEWDKQLRDWIVREMNHWYQGESAPSSIWSADFDGMTELLTCFGWSLKNTEFYPLLDACRLVVNVYKHGEGKSLSLLKDRYPEYLKNPFEAVSGGWSEVSHRDHTSLVVSEEQILGFSDAIVAFWQFVPENTFNTQIGDAPKWLEKAMKKDERN